MKLPILAVTVMCINGCFTVKDNSDGQIVWLIVYSQQAKIDSLRLALKDCKEQSVRYTPRIWNYQPYHLDTAVVRPRGYGIIRTVPNQLYFDSSYIPNFDHK